MFEPSGSAPSYPQGTPNDVKYFPVGNRSRSKSIPISYSGSSLAKPQEQSDEAIVDYREYVMYRRIQEGTKHLHRQAPCHSSGNDRGQDEQGTRNLGLVELTLRSNQSFLMDGTHVHEEITRYGPAQHPLAGDCHRSLPAVVYSRGSTNQHVLTRESSFDDGVFDMDL